jgi:hypothetical protein
MKNIKYIFSALTLFLFASCEEVVDVDLDTAAPRLVIEASIDADVNATEPTQQIVKLTTTTSYYSKDFPVVPGATVFITDALGTVYNFTETPGTGKYVCTTLAPVVGNEYTLTVISNGQTYTAIETAQATPEITKTVQTNDGGFLGEDIEVRFYYNDPGDKDNYYLTRVDSRVDPYPIYDVRDNEFSRGNEMFDINSDEDYKAGDVIKFKLYGISKRYYDYMSVLIENAGGGGPFSSVPVAAKGNIINQTDQSNYALGYFRIGEVSQLDYTIN